MSIIGTGTLAGLARIRNYKSKRVSSWDRKGANDDSEPFRPGERRDIALIDGPGCVKHIWMTIGCREPAYPRRAVIRMYWDGADRPAVEVPIGDFFGVGHGVLVNYHSLPLSMSPQSGKGMNCFFPMPFSTGARIEIAAETGAEDFHLYYYVDYEAYDSPDVLGPVEDLGYFHAQWRRENLTKGWGEDIARSELSSRVWNVPNLTGDENYVILEAQGRGHYVGCNLNIDCVSREKNDWYGEGDDMIFIDGEPFPPSLHGTGTEDYFCMAYCPWDAFSGPYYGLPLYSGNPDWPWKGKNSMYRYHIEDPIHFEKSIRVTIEHGHANSLSNDYSSTAYWYQTLPTGPFPELLPVEQRLPLPNEPQWVPK
jgi:hypothetical protein